MVRRNYPEVLKLAAKQNVKNREFWLEQLSGDLVKTSFPFDINNITVNELIIESMEFRFPGTWEKELFSKLMELTKGSNYTLNLLLISAVTLLLGRYTGQRDILVGTPIHKQQIEGDFVNTVLVLRNRIENNKTFKEFLLQVRQTIKETNENQNYPLEILIEELSGDTGDNIYPFDVAVLLENIHEKEYLRDVRCNVIFSFVKEEDCIKGLLEYNSALYTKIAAKQIITHFIHLLRHALSNVDLPLSRLEMLTEEEKSQILYDFNNTKVGYPKDKTFQQLFEDQVVRTPDSIAVCTSVELNDIFQGTSCFKKNPYVFQAGLEYLNMNLKLSKTHHHNCVVVNHNTFKLIELFDGQETIESIYSRLKDLTDIRFIIYTVEIGDMLEITHDFNRKVQVFSNMDFDDFIRMVKLLYESHLIELTAVKSDKIKSEKESWERWEDFGTGEFEDYQIDSSELFFQNRSYSHADILLLGDTPGMPSTGLLYITSYLKRNGINALCRFYDKAVDYQSMKTDIEYLLEQIRPGIVAVSLKWFLYIARVLDMCKIVKEYAEKSSISIKVVVGGNTASYYYSDMIKYEYIDCIIRGDGEFPLLQICKDENFVDIPNCVYKNDGKVLQTPFSYIKGITGSSDIYLSHLDEIIFPVHTVPLGTFFIYTHLGCARSCIYCGGCKNAQEQTFNRKTFFIRPTAEVRKDIIEAMPYASTFQFDFDTAPGDILEYCRDIWEGLDLSCHFAIISRLHLPSASFIELAARTFKYVYWDIDVLTLSERHRMQLVSMGLVKPQPTDSEILALLDEFDRYDNLEVRFNVINGLPYFTIEDIDKAEKFLTRVMSIHRSFSELHWARLHAQPGAPIAADAEKYDMHSFATHYEDFLEHSKQNFNSTVTARLEHLNYPYVYFNDEVLNSKLTLHYNEANNKIRQYKENRLIDRTIGVSLTYKQLDEKASRLAGLLRNKGVTSGSIAGIMLNPSLDIPLAILAVWKAGAAYLPIDPDYPKERIKYMLKDSNAQALVVADDTSCASWLSFGPKALLNLSEGHHLNFPTSQLPSFPVSLPSSLAYIIYTSGTTGKPKGVIITHRNLTNYTCWFTQKNHLTHHDKTILTSSFAFDLGYTSIYPSLLNGCELHVLPREIFLSPGKLLDYIDKKGITYIKVTPSLLKVIVNSLEFSSRKCRSLRLAVVGGEPINLKDIDAAHNVCSHLEIMNHYGPTEATIGCIARYIDFQRFEEYKVNPTIGKPISNSSAFVLDKDFNLLPVGVPGELCISGAGLGMGYLNNPELTFEKFCLRRPGGTLFEGTGKDHMQSCNYAAMQLPLHHSHHSTTHHSPLTIYRTGDLARWMPDGNIEFLGRIDTQLKIRGYRVEVEEIKNHLLKQSHIKEAFVLPREDKDGNKYLCAYIVPDKGEIETKEEENQKILSLKEIENQIKSAAPLNIDPGIENEVIEETIVEVFEKQAAQSPGKTVIESNGKAWTYAAVNRYANRIGRLISGKYDDRYKLSKSEKIRYKRQMLLHGWGVAFQEKLKSTTVFVAGAGGGGSPTIMQLALLGVGTIKVCDYDEIELSNLNRQFLHEEERIGMNKALSAQITVNKVNPNVTVIPIKEKLTHENVFELVGDSDIIFDMFDGLADKFILSECAVAKQIPHIIISMADLNAYSAVLHPPHTPCYHCIFSKEKLDTITAGMKNVVENYSKNPLAVAATSLFISTGTAINEALKLLMGMDEPAYNKFFYFNQRGDNENLRFTPSYKSMTHLFSDHFLQVSREQGFDWETGWRGNLLEVLNIVPDPDCPLCGEKGEERRIALEQRLQKQTIAMIPDQAVDENINHRLKPVALLADDQVDSFYISASIMGILKAGKTCVPLDPALNENQLCDLLDSSEVRVILTASKHMDTADKLRHKVNSRIPVIDVNEIDETINEENLAFNVEGDDIAYLLFSPGSTGLQESVSQTHREILHFLRFCSRYSRHHPGNLFPSPSAVHMEISLPGHLAKLLGSDLSFINPGNREADSYSLSRLKENLLKELPEYMVPSYFIEVEKWPLTPNGKIDQKSLPEPGTVQTPVENSRPPNEIEDKLMGIWSEIVGIEKRKIGIEQNLFELGGNSLHLITLVSKIHQEFGIEVPIARIFENPTVKEIALWINTNNFADSPVMLLNRPAKKKLFLFPPQLPYGVFYRELASIITDYSFYTFSFIEEEDRLEQYARLITNLQPNGPYILFGYSAAGRLTFQVARELGKKGYEVSDIIFVECFFTQGQAPIIDEEFLKRNREVMADFMDRWGLPFLKEKVITKSEKYMKYIGSIDHLEKINTTVHLLLTEEFRNSEHLHSNSNTNCWDIVSSKKSLTYEILGTHHSALSPGTVEKNAEVIKKILDQIESERSAGK
jgi:amino acid adenylation domain-containing protein